MVRATLKADSKAMTPNDYQKGFVLEDIPATLAWLSDLLQEVFPLMEVQTAPAIAPARRLLATYRPQLALVDLGLPDGSGVDIIRLLAKNAPDCQIIVTTLYADDQHLFPALRAGAHGYLLKDQPREKIKAGLEQMAAGEPPLSPVIAQRLLRVFSAQAPQEGEEAKLSPRETEVLTLVAKGLRLPELVEKLGVTRNTAAGYIKSIYRKLNVSSRAEATLEAARMGLVNTAM